MAKIAIFLTALDGGGAERVMLNLARGFTDGGWDVDLLLVQAEGAYISQIPPQVKVVNLNKPRLLLSIPALITYLQTEQPIALLAALDTNLVSVWGRKLAGVSTQVIVTVHNVLSQECAQSKQLKRRLTPQLAKTFYPWADTIVAVSQGVKDDLVNLGLPAHQIQVIYNPIVTPELREQIPDTTVHPWFATGQPPVILAVGRLTPQKDFSTLIRAFAQVRQQKSVRLMILGEGEERSSLENLSQQLSISEDVALPGFVSHPHVFMAQAAMLVLSSAWEGFGNVLVEAMAMGTPVVSTNCKSGPGEILADGRYGKLVAVGDDNSMAKAIVSTLASTPDADLLQKRAWEFSLETAVMQYESLLN